MSRRPAVRHSIGGLVLMLVMGACGNAGPDEPADHAEAEHGHEEVGDPIDVIEMDSARLAMADLRIGPVATVRTGVLPVTGTITYDANRVSHVGPRIEGRIVRLAADLGSQVQRGAPLAILESAEVGVLRTDLEEASVMVAIAEENYQREQRLEEQGISSRRELLDARSDLQRARSSRQAAASRLQILGANRGSGGEFPLVAPFDGVVVEKHASLGEVAGPTDQIFTIADLSSLWIELNIFERNLTDVYPGLDVNISASAYPDRVFPGRIVYVGDILEPQSRTVQARVEIDNPDGALKPGMFARAAIETGGATGVQRISVDRGAVQNIEGRTAVWAEGDHPGEFVPVDVTVGEDLGDGQVEIVSGLEPGDRIVQGGAFTLTSELSRGEFGGHSH